MFVKLSSWIFVYQWNDLLAFAGFQIQLRKLEDYCRIKRRKAKARGMFMPFVYKKFLPWERWWELKQGSDEIFLIKLIKVDSLPTSVSVNAFCALVKIQFQGHTFSRNFHFRYQSSIQLNMQWEKHYRNNKPSHLLNWYVFFIIK